MSAKPKIFVQSEIDCPQRRKFWVDNHWDVEWVQEDASTVLKQKSADLLIVAPEQSLEWMEIAKKTPIEISRIGFCDSLWLQEGSYWPRALYKDLLRDFVVRIAKTLDIGAWIYIAGDTAWAQMFVFLASDIGYRKICLLGDNQEALEKIIQKSQRHCFGIEMKILAPPDLTQEANNGSMLINTYDFEKNADLLQTLLYLNFVHQPGLIMDTFYNGKISPLLGEARQIGFEIISGVDVRALYDFALLEKLKVANQVPWPTYLTSWRAFLGLS